MATTARQPKPQRKGPDAARRPPAWTGARASPTFSPGVSNARLPATQPPAPPGGFPPLAQTNGPAPRPDRPQDRMLQQLTGLTGTTITLSTKTNQRYEGVVASTSGEGDTTGVTLKDVKEITNPGAPLKEQLFIASTNIDTWLSGPADAKMPNGDTFKTDTDISQKTAPRRERELQAWQPADEAAASAAGNGPHGPHTDDLTFGPGASQGNTSWDQFAVNEKLFGVKAGFDETQYTTKLDRNAPDYKEREKKAAVIASEILGTVTGNIHIAEERVMNFTGEAGINEEDRYGAVVRSANAYVPPGARKSVTIANPSTTSAKSEIPKVAVNAPDGSTVPTSNQAPTPPSAPSPAPGGTATNKPAADPLPAFRDFVSNERDRLLKKKQALMKNEMDKRMAELIKFSKNFKLNKPIPDDLVPILAKDEEKQRSIKEKSSKDAESSSARAIGPLNMNASPNAGAGPSAARVSPPAPGSAKVPAAVPEIAKQSSTAGLATSKSRAGIAPGKSGTLPEQGKGRIGMVIQPIPPFKGPKRSSTANTPSPPTNGATSSNGTNASHAHAGRAAPSATHVKVNVNTGATNAGPPSATPMSPTAANRLNVNASSFRPNVKASTFTPPGGSPNANGSTSAAASPKPKAGEANVTQGPPNPFFGTRPLKKGPPVHIKDDFNPFKYNKVVEAPQVPAMWPYNGKRYMQMFPPLPAPPQQPSPHLAPPGPPPPLPPPSYEEDAAARGYVYAYPPYGYPGQPMMPGMAPPPPGTYMAGPYMQHLPYGQMPPPNAMYPTTPMGQMPPHQMYMQPPPPPGSYPPPNGAGPRPSMPPTPIPSHAHPYYHQSPQLQHAVPYPMMMPPPGAPGVPHPYESQPVPPMGNVGHA